MIFVALFGNTERLEGAGDEDAGFQFALSSIP
jgi:hypothetical protein